MRKAIVLWLVVAGALLWVAALRAQPVATAGCDLVVLAPDYEHWMDVWKTESPIAFAEWSKNADNAAEFAARNKAGDIIAVYPYGHCIEKPGPGSRMRIVRVEGLAYADAKGVYDQPLMDGDILKAKRARRVKVEALALSDGKVDLTAAQLAVNLEMKTAVEIVR